MVVPRSICRGEMKPLRRQITKGGLKRTSTTTTTTTLTTTRTSTTARATMKTEIPEHIIIQRTTPFFYFYNYNLSHHENEDDEMTRSTTTTSRSLNIQDPVPAEGGTSSFIFSEKIDD